MAIELLEPANAKAYRKLMLEAYAQHPEAFVSSITQREKLPLSWWEAKLDDELSALFGAFVDSRLVGIVGLAFEPWEDARHKTTLFGLYVSQAFRGQGLGEHLVQAVVSLAEQEPETKVIELTVSANSDAALALYQRCGFAQSGLEDCAIRVGEAYYDRVHMRRLVNIEEN
ncbi:GNAT family N-acetyltransferase [Pseudomonas sp. FSL R10-0056]|uniref:GCN5-like N-acetyltransferase n=1 Tax=Pseudomonas fragi TaxID=296 RepID=A0A449IP36_PSEFR|nr:MULTISPECIES: GNAT family N-acetyltransferase [Pseudomonas]MQT63626.1 GNAT family N-acetyltransferase [Pseudomonas sp. FSL R10-0056]MQT69560.1 GNAT family N-acetyltransferase [Pseudomonas sp. FSL R10-0071]MQT85618.1 GNAT family N-acetyltransferase [Pseudomonas sp. FSL R10-2964]MQU48260.1 GNAT family N-acetyltransferase [Pseudomonas sp. FSL A6-1183]MQU52514.1 GNAT family N-acetyltransferase [Pseudomonas sp. FSL R10-1339]